MPDVAVRTPSVVQSGIWSDIGPVSRVETVRNQSQSEIGPVSLRTDHPPFRGSGPSDRGRSKSDSLARWRHSQRYVEAKADWTEIESTWLWLTMSDVEQRVICSASEIHRKRHQGKCLARHGHPGEKP